MTVLSATDVTVRLGGNTILDGAAIAVAAGEVIGLIGPNGAGKTTFLRVLAGLQAAEAGAVLVGDRPLAALDRREAARRMAYLPQGAVAHWPLTVENLVALGRLPHRTSWQRFDGGHARAIERAMTDADVSHLWGRTVKTLSGGEAMRVMLARALATEPSILLADEPVASLDPYHQLQVMELLKRMTGRGGAVIVVLHDLALAARFCDRLVLIDHGRVVGDGPPAEVLRPEHLAATYHIKAFHGTAGGESFVIPWRRLPGQDGVQEGKV
jgi:iron complex transport system ATP-binding protein